MSNNTLALKRPSNQGIYGYISRKIKGKGSGWLFIDNCDVYDYAHKKDIFDGLTVILKKIRAMGKPVVVNGGDT